MKFLLILWLILISTPLHAGTGYKDVQTYTTDKTPRPYVVIGQMGEKARTDKSCVRQMAKKAVKKGGQALINIEINPTGAKGMWFGANVLHCKAVVVRWAEVGEKGQTALNPNDPIPFIFK